MVRRWVLVLALGGAWWWAVLRLLLAPEHAGPVEGAVAAGGWGLSLLPVHVTATVRPGRPAKRTEPHRRENSEFGVE
ncbi:hypothetical protein [Streptomyces sp. NBC_00887]|uniref:hypothetical protein n=1 Tax=Streptomyces sp. NBC_00887 TaxID=2975859 RepID=UPI003863CDB4|nr:hypothetical protein OG844_18705 [Streptomyces sp. NBC_00887]